MTSAPTGACTYIVSPDRLGRLRILAPELAANLDLVASNVPSDRIIAADGSSLLIAVDPAPEITVSNVAALHLDDDPRPVVDGTVAAPVTALWQVATMAARVIHFISFVKRRATAVSYIDGASW